MISDDFLFYHRFPTNKMMICQGHIKEMEIDFFFKTEKITTRLYFVVSLVGPSYAVWSLLSDQAMRLSFNKIPAKDGRF